MISKRRDTYVDFNIVFWEIFDKLGKSIAYEKKNQELSSQFELIVIVLTFFL